jgi:hypothetical protein
VTQEEGDRYWPQIADRRYSFDVGHQEASELRALLGDGGESEVEALRREILAHFDRHLRLGSETLRCVVVQVIGNGSDIGQGHRDGDGESKRSKGRTGEPAVPGTAAQVSSSAVPPAPPPPGCPPGPDQDAGASSSAITELGSELLGSVKNLDVHVVGQDEEELLRFRAALGSYPSMVID